MKKRLFGRKYAYKHVPPKHAGVYDLEGTDYKAKTKIADNIPIKIANNRMIITVEFKS